MRARDTLVLGIALASCVMPPSSSAAGPDPPVRVAREADTVLDLPFAGYCSRPAWDPSTPPGRYRLAFDVTGVEGGLTGRIVILDSLAVSGDRLAAVSWQVLPSNVQLREAIREGGYIDTSKINVQQLAWGPQPACRFVFCANGTPVSSAEAQAWFGGPLALYADPWDRFLARVGDRAGESARGGLSGRSEFRSPTVAPGGTVIFEYRDDVKRQSDLCAIHPVVPESEQRFFHLTTTGDLAESLPVVSPDGKLVAFVYESADRDPELAVAELHRNADGSMRLRNPRRLRTGTASFLGLAPAWCPAAFESGGEEKRLLAFYRPQMRSTEEGPRTFDLCLALVDVHGADAPVRCVQSDVLVHTKVRGANPPAWTGDGRYLFYIARDGLTDPLQVVRAPRTAKEFRERLYTWPLESGTVLNKFVAVAPDNRVLAVMAAGSRAEDELRVGVHPHWLYLLPLRWSEDDGGRGGIDNEQ